MIINSIELNIAPRADLHGANLRSANLHSIDLHGANLHGANLRDADLHGASLQGADLQGADLRGANLRGANLRGANLRSANLRGADLRGADLCGADANGADLRDASLHGANLRGADLSATNLYNADLLDANLRDANLRGVQNMPSLAAARLSIVPNGDLIVWKKLQNNIICKLHIPSDAKRSNATSRKCRAAYAIVLEGEGVSKYDHSFAYRLNERVEPHEPFDEDRWEECASGIHFFLTYEEAEDY